MTGERWAYAGIAQSQKKTGTMKILDDLVNHVWWFQSLLRYVSDVEIDPIPAFYVIELIFLLEYWYFNYLG